MRPLILELGLPLADNENAIAEGAPAAQAMMKMSWTDKFVAIVSIIREHGLPQYEALAGMVSAEEKKRHACLGRVYGRARAHYFGGG